jgi:diguanylate cyclase (GGDEF)-like protein/PAS domain S-box-containing protein
MQSNLDPPQGRTGEDRLQRLIDCIESDGIYMLDRRGHIMTWNRGAALNQGYTQDEIIGKHFRLFFVPEDIQAGLPDKLFAEAVRKGHYTGEGWRLRKNGERFWASVVLTAMHDSAGTLAGFAKVVRDLTPQKRRQETLQAAQAALQEERDRLYAVAENSLDALFVCEAIRNQSGIIEDFVFTYLNSNVEKLVSRPRARMLGGRMSELLANHRIAGCFEKYRHVVLTGKPLIEEFAVEDNDVTSPWLRVQAVKLRDGIAITASDITERKRIEKRTEYTAQHDPLTGLPNRMLLYDRIDQAIAHAKRDKTMVALLLIDLDGFKEINDSLGHAAGDEVLCAVARRLTNSIRASDSAMRIGGDEFVAILPGVKAIRELVCVVDKILNAIRLPIASGLQTVRVTSSIGIAVFPQSAANSSELLKRADDAMYACKRAGKNQYRFFHRAPGAKHAKVAVSPSQLQGTPLQR